MASFYVIKFVAIVLDVLVELGWVTPIPLPTNMVAVHIPVILMFPVMVLFSEIETPLVNSTAPDPAKFAISFTFKVDTLSSPYTIENDIPAPTITVAPIETGPNIP